MERLSGRREKSIFSLTNFEKSQLFIEFRSILRRWLKAAATIFLNLT